jgi:hypothetical protein
MQHPVANEVPVPTEAIERELKRYAVPGFTGRRIVHLRVRPEAALAVEILPEAIETQRIGDRNRMVSPGDVFERREPTERELIVRQLLAANDYRFRLSMRLTAVVGDYTDGKLLRAQWVTVG